MKWLSILAGTVAVLSMAQSTNARALVDCPLRDAPFSVDGPLVDVLLNDTARAVVERQLPGRLAQLPPLLTGTIAPTFAAIVTLRQAASFMAAEPAAIEPIDTALRRLPVTDADRIARCARYDDDRPSIRVASQDRAKPRLLLFEKINGFKDVPGFEAAHAAVLDLAREHGWAVVTTDRGGAMNASVLRQFDAVVWNNISGDVLTLPQRAAFRAWIERGGAYIGFHGSAGDPTTFWDWYADDLIGARFIGHPMNPQYQEARITFDDPLHPLAAGLPRDWRWTDEWYSFAASPRAKGVQVLASLDETTYSPVGFGPSGTGGQDLAMGDHPIAWTRCVGKGRMFYTAIGHRPESYQQPQMRQLIVNAVSWTADHEKPCKVNAPPPE